MKTSGKRKPSKIPTPRRLKRVDINEKSLGDIQQERTEYVLQRDDLSKEWLENESEKKRLEVRLLHTSLNMRALEKKIEELSEKESILRNEVERRMDKEGRCENTTLPVICRKTDKNNSYSSKLRNSIGSSSLPPINRNLKCRASKITEEENRPTAPSKSFRRGS